MLCCDFVNGPKDYYLKLFLLIIYNEFCIKLEKRKTEAISISWPHCKYNLMLQSLSYFVNKKISDNRPKGLFEKWTIIVAHLIVLYAILKCGLK